MFWLVWKLFLLLQWSNWEFLQQFLDVGVCVEEPYGAHMGPIRAPYWLLYGLFVNVNQIVSTPVVHTMHWIVFTNLGVIKHIINDKCKHILMYESDERSLSVYEIFYYYLVTAHMGPIWGPYGAHMGHAWWEQVKWKNCDILKNMNVLFTANEIWACLSLLALGINYRATYNGQF